MAYSLFKQRLVILVHTRSSPSAGEWTAYCDDTQRWRRSVESYLVVSDGGGPNASQRAELREAVEAETTSARTAVVTVSPIARGIVTAIGWFNPGIRAFSTVRLHDALDYLRVTDSERGGVLAELARLRERL